MTRIALIGDYNPASPSHAATTAAVRHAADRLKLEVASAWIPTPELDDTLFAECDAVWIAPGSPYADMAKVLAAIRFARENSVPCLGTCGGFQHMVIEYARNVLGVAGAAHGEVDPTAAEQFITPLACSLLGRSMNITFKPESRIADAYASTSATEQYTCSMGVNPERVAELKQGPLQITGSDGEGEARVIELPEHPFFIGTLFLPQLRSLPGRPHPLVSTFVRIAAKRAKAR
ncbi:MAG TPA: hypothetical protein VJR89_37475 [Polyangiales bacterium]|nr:hypothetical protein [Polyangiales bacterium]